MTILSAILVTVVFFAPYIYLAWPSGGKPIRTMLQWSHNIYGQHHLSLWLLNDEDAGCFEYSTAVGNTKVVTIWRLFCRLRKQHQLYALWRVRKVEHTSSCWKGKLIHFKIKEVNERFFLICQRHTILFFIHFYDSGAEILCPNYRASSSYEAHKIIEAAASESHFRFLIHT